MLPWGGGSVCRPLLDKDTASKMSVLTEQDVHKGMREYFDESEIEIRLGGKLDIGMARTRRVNLSGPESGALLSRAGSWEDRDGCGVARVWKYRDMMELQRKFVPEEYHHMLVDTPRKLAAKRAHEVADKLSSAPSTPSARAECWESSSAGDGDRLRWGGEGERSPATANMHAGMLSRTAPAAADRRAEADVREATQPAAAGEQASCVAGAAAAAAASGGATGRGDAGVVSPETCALQQATRDRRITCLGAAPSQPPSSAVSDRLPSADGSRCPNAGAGRDGGALAPVAPGGAPKPALAAAAAPANATSADARQVAGAGAVVNINWAVLRRGLCETAVAVGVVGGALLARLFGLSAVVFAALRGRAARGVGVGVHDAKVEKVKAVPGQEGVGEGVQAKGAGAR